MIGGTDIVIPNPGRSAPEALDAIVRTIQSEWPQMVLQDGATGTQFAAYNTVPFSTLSEVFVYRDGTAFASWEAIEAAPSNANTMLHVVVNDEFVTLVVDEPADEVVLRILQAITDMLNLGMSWESAA